MISYYLDFEQPIKDLDTQILELESSKEPNQVNMKKLNKLKAKRIVEIENIYSGLSRWQRVQLARHPNRPYSLDYINYFSPDFIELHGDRHFMDDPAVVAGLGHFGDQKVAWVGQQKGRNTKERQFRNFGMANPEGYRKALRLMKMAEKFEKPVVCLIDTPGAFPGLEAEERGQGEAIARNILEMTKLQTPIIVVIIGEGASGGALGIGVGDKILMLNNAWYSVISPENCSTILWKSWDNATRRSYRARAEELQIFGRGHPQAVVFRSPLIDLQDIKLTLPNAVFIKGDIIYIVR